MMPTLQKYDNYEYIENFENFLFGNIFKMMNITFHNLTSKLKTNCAYN